MKLDKLFDKFDDVKAKIKTVFCSKEIRPGDVVRTLGWARFEPDVTNVEEVSPGHIRLMMTIYGDGTLAVVLGTETNRLRVLVLDSGKTGWFSRSSLQPYNV